MTDSACNETNWDQVARALAIARVEDEQRALAGMCAPEKPSSLLGLETRAVRHFWCRFGYNDLPEYRVYAREFAEAYAIGVLSCDRLSWNRLRCLRVICRLKRIENRKHTVYLDVQARCWGKSHEGLRRAFEPSHESGMPALSVLRACLRHQKVWKSIFWLDEPSGCFSVQYPGRLSHEFFQSNCVRYLPFTMLKIDDIPAARHRAAQVKAFAFGELPDRG